MRNKKEDVLVLTKSRIRERTSMILLLGIILTILILVITKPIVIAEAYRPYFNFDVPYVEKIESSEEFTNIVEHISLEAFFKSNGKADYNLGEFTEKFELNLEIDCLSTEYEVIRRILNRSKNPRSRKERYDFSSDADYKAYLIQSLKQVVSKANNEFACGDIKDAYHQVMEGVRIDYEFKNILNYHDYYGFDMLFAPVAKVFFLGSDITLVKGLDYLTHGDRSKGIRSIEYAIKFYREGVLRCLENQTRIKCHKQISSEKQDKFLSESYTEFLKKEEIRRIQLAIKCAEYFDCAELTQGRNNLNPMQIKEVKQYLFH